MIIIIIISGNMASALLPLLLPEEGYPPTPQVKEKERINERRKKRKKEKGKKKKKDRRAKTVYRYRATQR